MRALSAKVQGYVDDLCERYACLEEIKQEIIDAYIVIEECYKHHGKMLIAGNGGSAADAEHIVGELMKSFVCKRTLDGAYKQSLIRADAEQGSILSEKLQGALPAIALDGHFALSTAFMNDVEPSLCFAQQVNGYGNKGDVLLAISTSGNSQNILFAAITARAKEMSVIGLTGRGESNLARLADVCVNAPQEETYKIQEMHLPIYHCWCLMLESTFFDVT